MVRFVFLLGVLLKYFFVYVAIKLGIYTKPKEKILRNFFEDAGGSFIKFGQLLVLGVDALPKNYALEMISLFDNVKPFPYQDVENLFLQELGATPEKIFKDFQKEPFAAASFGQVHAAQMHDNTLVAVKVLRPGIENKVATDFFIVSIFAFFADLFFKVDALPWKEFAKEFKKWTKEELDYYLEAQRMQTIYKTAINDKYVIIPKVYPHLSTKKILVEDYIEGIALSKVLLGLKNGKLTHNLQEYGIDLKKVPKIMIREIFREFFLGTIFHADPHPGNILLLQNGKVAFIDFGIVGESLKYNKASFAEFIKAAAAFDYRKGVYHFANFAGEYLKNMIGSALPASVSQKQVDEFMTFASNYFSEEVEKITNEKKRRLEHMQEDYTVAYFHILKAGKKFRVKVPNEAVLFIRTLTIAGFLAKQLDYDFKLADETKKFFAEFPQDLWLKSIDETAPYKRLSHEKAIEQLNGWLSYLVEVDLKLYHLIKDYLKQYRLVDR